MRYVEARIDEHFREEAYRIYVTKSLQLAPQYKWLQKDYYDSLDRNREEEKSGDEIACDVISKAGLKFG